MIDVPDEIVAALAGAETHLQSARADLAQLYDGNHVDAGHLVKALAAMRLATGKIDTATAHAALKARGLAVSWSVIGTALGTSKQNAQQKYGKST